MALIECRFYSETLNRETSMYVILPTISFDDVMQRRKPIIYPDEKYRTLYLLHGLGQNYTDWIRNTSIERYAQEKGIAVVMPDAGNSLYSDMVHGSAFWSFLSTELPSVCRRLFPLSGNREDNFIAGVSMGGYGAFKLGLLKMDQYAAAASLSGSPDISPMVAMAEQLPSVRKLLENTFGDPGSILGSESDLMYQFKSLRNKENIPMLYLAYGKQDPGYPLAIRGRDQLMELSIPLTYEESDGGHDWSYWDQAIKKVLNWLPIPAVE